MFLLWNYIVELDKNLLFGVCSKLISFWTIPILNAPVQLSRYSEKSRGWTTEELWFNTRQGKNIFVCSKMFTPSLGPTHPLFSCYLGLFTRLKHPRSEVNHSLTHQTNAQLKNKWNYTSALPIHLHTVDRDKFIFTFTAPRQFLCSSNLSIMGIMPKHDRKWLVMMLICQL